MYFADTEVILSFIDGKTETLCIYGSPVAHSKSPAMHNALFKALGINAVYVPYAPDPQNLETAIAGFRAMKFRGANVTIPYKSDVAKLVDEISPISQFTGSVNTLYWKDGVAGGTLCGTTTDPYGCIRNLEENGVKVQGKKVALLGNGGAAKAIAYTLLEQKNQLTIVCRSKEKGMDLAKNLEPSFGSQRCTVTTFDEFPTVSNAIDIIINATSVGMEPNIDQSPLDGNTIHSSQVVCDIVYAPPMTKLLKMAQAKGCKIVTGEGMLVHQGLESFKKWFPAETAGKTNEELTSIMRNGMRV